MTRTTSLAALASLPAGRVQVLGYEPQRGGQADYEIDCRVSYQEYRLACRYEYEAAADRLERTLAEAVCDVVASCQPAWALASEQETGEDEEREARAAVERLAVETIARWRDAAEGCLRAPDSRGGVYEREGALYVAGVLIGRNEVRPALVRPTKRDARREAEREVVAHLSAHAGLDLPEWRTLRLDDGRFARLEATCDRDVFVVEMAETVAA